MDVQTGISVAMIVKNEALTLSRALDSVARIVDEIIVVDSGSTDATVSLAKLHPSCPKVYETKWNDDFSELRNYAISLCTYSYCLMLDADEFIAEGSRKLLRHLIYSAMESDNNSLFAPLIDNLDGTTLVNNPRIFRIRETLNYKGRVHEYLNEDGECHVKYIHDIVINHTGYNEKTYNEKKKESRNLYLLRKQIADDPVNLRWYYFLFRYLEEDSPESIQILNKFGELSLPYPDAIEVYAFNLKTMLIMHLMVTDEFKQAFNHARQLYSHYKDRNSTILFMVTSLVNSMDDFEEKIMNYIEGAKNLSEIHEDNLLHVRAPDDYVQKCLMFIMMRLDRIRTSYEQ